MIFAQSIFPTGEEFNKMDKKQQNTWIKLLLSNSYKNQDILKAIKNSKEKRKELDE